MVHLTTALDAVSGVPLYEQLYRSLAAEMRTGAISAGTRMPGKRRLAAELCTGISGSARADRVRRAAPARGSASAGAARPLRPLHPGRRPGAVSVPHMGAAAKRAAVLFAGAADPR